jgi:hypothetical protein
LPTPATHFRAFLLACSALAACAIGVGGASAQRIQIPTTAPGVTPYGGTSVYPAAPAGSSVYPANPAYSAPAGTPVYPATPAPTYPATPQLTLPTYPSIPAAPAYDPYANPSLGAPPVDVPYAASPYGAPPPPSVVGAPYPSSPATATGSTLFENGSTPQWSNSATYNQLNPDGTVQRLQRFLQQISLEHTYLYGDHGPGDLAINRTEMAATFGVPIFYNPHTPLLITPGFAFNWLEGPIGPDADLPPRVYDAYLDTAWYPRFSPMLGADLGVRTGVWTDFKAVNSDSIRILGRGLGIITLSPRMDLLAGVWYIDRNDIKLLPAGGVHWKPNTEWDAYLVFPNPKVRKRFVNIGSSQWWWYVAGEYGGGRWTVERDPAGVAMGADDDIDINDIRVIGGFEWETQTQARGHVEAGYVFNREIIYDGTRLPPSFNLDDTFMIRLGFDF